LYGQRQILAVVMRLFTVLQAYILSAKFVMLYKHQNYVTEGFEYISFSKVLKNIHAIQKLIFESVTMLFCQTKHMNYKWVYLKPNTVLYFYLLTVIAREVLHPKNPHFTLNLRLSFA